MGLLDKLTSSILGLKGAQPANFGVNPVPPNSLHDQFSVDGNPDVTWRTINGNGPKPQPSRLDIGDSKHKYKPTSKYTG